MHARPDVISPRFFCTGRHQPRKPFHHPRPGFDITTRPRVLAFACSLKGNHSHAMSSSEGQRTPSILNFVTSLFPKPVACERHTPHFGIRRPSDAGADTIVNDSTFLHSPRPHEQPSDYRAWYMFKLGELESKAPMPFNAAPPQ